MAKKTATFLLRRCPAMGNRTVNFNLEIFWALLVCILDSSVHSMAPAHSRFKMLSLQASYLGESAGTDKPKKTFTRLDSWSGSMGPATSCVIIEIIPQGGWKPVIPDTAHPTPHSSPVCSTVLVNTDIREACLILGRQQRAYEFSSAGREEQRGKDLIKGEGLVLVQ